MASVGDWELSLINPEQLTATDLQQEYAAAEQEGDTDMLCYFLRHVETNEVAQMVYFEAYGRAGIAMGADAVWTDCDSATEAVRRWASDDLRP